MSKIKQVGNITYLEEEMEITGLSTTEKSIEEFNDYLLKKISKVEKENIKLKERKEKLENAWEIVKENPEEIMSVISCESFEKYQRIYFPSNCLKEEQFNLLKEMLK